MYGNDKNFVNFNSIEDIIPDLEYGPNRAVYNGDKRPTPSMEKVMMRNPRIILPRFYKSHEPMHRYRTMCPNCPGEWKRIIYIVRDGRDVMCSYYNFQKNLGHNTAMNKTFLEFLTEFSDPKDGPPIYPGVTWGDHVMSFFEVDDDPSSPQILWVRYEDLHTRPKKVLQDIFEFLEVTIPEDSILQQAIDASSKEKMKRKEEEGGAKLFDKHHAMRDQDFRVVRKAVTGGWAECFGSDQGLSQDGSRTPQEDPSTNNQADLKDNAKTFNHDNLLMMMVLEYVDNGTWWSDNKQFK
eukprot:CAMPEP_0113934014 /NCGR_PEP_ID=MMETSP1339-20121228/1354_1 /TAXON_ID=94617 /ORGANISM="Fibrocapsa japonica" /LENGTH=294 /DNA_ID=CAMNT_0000935617 /DNA_START=239 /DNA_END=1123 /DNA_ORIENTATION=- /assembly_acc=CAM_ASM_000762